MSVIHWVLIVYLGWGYGGGPTKVDGFTSKSSCQEALAKINRDTKGFKGPTSIYGYCVEVK